MFLITGGTGLTGGQVARTLLADGRPVRALVRDPERAAPLRALGAEVVSGDLADASALAAALDGAAGAYLVNPPPWGAPDPLAASAAVSAAMAEALAGAAVDRAVVLTARGAHERSGGGLIEMAAANERAVRGAGGAVSFLRPCSFMENWGSVAGAAREGGRLPSFYVPVDRPVDMVAAADIAAVAVDLLIGRRNPETDFVEVTGPAPAGADEVAAAFARRLGRAVTAVAVPPERHAAVLVENGLGPALAGMLAEMYEAINADAIRFEDPEAVVRGETTLDAAVAGLVPATAAPA